MLRSLRFQLPALFLLGVVVAGLVSAAIALRLFRSYAQDQSRSQAYTELKKESSGLKQLYGQQAGLKLLSPSRLELATGDRIYYRGLDLFPGQKARFRPLPPRAVDQRLVRRRGLRFFVFRPPDAQTKLLAVARPLFVGKRFWGTIVVAKPETILAQRWLALIERLLIAFAGGVLVAAAFAWYSSRRITTPVLRLSAAADEVAHGNYDVDVPSGGAGEIGELADRFGQMASRLGEAEELERNFLMTVSHELRTPLTAIRGHVEALREGVVEDPELRTASLDVISSEALRLERLVGDVLDLAKLDTRRFTVRHEEVDMARLLEQAYVAFGEEAKQRKIDYSQEVSAEPVIVTDGDRVLQIITNLLANAFRWTPNGGSVGLHLSSENGNIHVAVEDTGPGIGPEEQDRIFRPFWTHDGKGTGLGLAIARELAMALGGRIDLDSEVGRGSKFELVLPTQQV